MFVDPEENKILGYLGFTDVTIGSFDLLRLSLLIYPCLSSIYCVFFVKYTCRNKTFEESMYDVDVI